MWIALSLLCALSVALADAVTRRALLGQGSGGALTAAWLRVMLSAPLTLLLLFFIDIPRLDSTFWLVFGAAMPFEVAATVLYVKALEVSPLSLTLPFLAFTPVFLIGVGRAMVGETIPPVGVAGIGLIAIGGYALNLGAARRGWLRPITAIWREKGSLMMLTVAMIFSVTASLLKIGIEKSSPLFYGAVYYAALGVVLTPLGIKGVGSVSRRAWRDYMWAGLFTAIMIVTNMAAMAMTKVAYMVSVKRTSLLFGVLFGWLFFKESDIRERALGAGLMFAGFVLLVNAA